jgi:glycosyltransferase involved in cell wall biosynthesis
MKLLHLIYDHSSNPWVGGGGAVRAYEMCRQLALRGHEITVLSGRYPGAENFREGKLSYEFIGTDRSYVLSTFSYALHTARYVRRRSVEFDLVVEDFAPWNPVFSALLSKRPSVLHINHREGVNILRRWHIAGILFYLVEALYPRLFRHVTALSEATRRKIKMPGAVVLPAGISREVLKEGESPSGEEEDYVLYVGRLQVQNKGLDTLMEAMRLLKGNGTGARLLLAGRGRDEERLREMARDLDVEFLGFVDEGEKLRLMRRARLFVLPSRFEGWGIVVLEAASCGKPVVVSDIPELSFALEAGFGTSFRTGDAEDLAGKLAHMLRDEPARERMGRRARQYAMDYTWEGLADKYERYLLDVLRQGGA